MGIYICPKCQFRVLFSHGTSDINHLCTPEGNSDVMRNESVPVIGDWEDYTGSGKVDSRTQQMFAGTTNQLQGQRAGIEGAKVPNLNIVGQDSSIYRRRQELRYIKLNGN